MGGIIEYKQNIGLPFGGSTSQLITKNIKTDEIYRVRFQYEQAGQWLSKRIFGFGIIWTEQPVKCEEGFWSPEYPIILD